MLTQYTITRTWTQDHERIDGVPTWVDRPGSDTYSITGNAFATGYNPTSQMTMRKPPWWVVVGVALAGLGAQVGGAKGHPINTHPDITVAEEAKPGDDVKRKQDKKEGGSNFTLQNIENYLKQSGSNARDNLDYLAEVLNRQNRQSPTIFGGAGGAWAWE